MRKNKLLRLASTLLVLTLLSTSIISGTFAKYTTSGNGSDTARVAKFGVTVSASSNTGFKTTYAKNTTDSSITYANTVVAGTVNDETDNVVAPGTSGDFTKVAISGTPEVAVKVSYSADLTLTGWTANGNEYCPIVFTVGENTYQLGTSESTGDTAKTYTSINALITAVQNAIAAYTKTYAAGTVLGNQSNDVPAISWSWPFSDSSDTAYQTDTKDTALGDAKTAPTISLAVTCTVEQID